MREDRELSTSDRLPVAEYEVYVFVFLKDLVVFVDFCTGRSGMADTDREYHDSVLGEVLQCVGDDILVGWMTNVASTLYQDHLPHTTSMSERLDVRRNKDTALCYTISGSGLVKFLKSQSRPG